MLATWGANQGFSPSSLFSSGEQGAWYDPSDLTTLFQDAAGTTPVTAVEQPVGLMLDKSKGLALGSELVTNGDFSDGTTGWGVSGTGISFANGLVTFTNSPRNATVYQAIPAPWNSLSAYFEITLKITSITSGAISIVKGGGGALATYTTAGTKVFRYYLPAGGHSNTNLFLYNDAETALSCVIDSFSVKQVLGNHAYQSTSANRPTLSARVNLLTKTEQFDNAVWTKANATVTANAVVAPDGTLSADRIIEDTSNTAHYVRASTNIVINASATVSCYVKKDGKNFAAIQCIGIAPNTCFFDLDSGSVTSGVTGGVVSVGNGWYRVWFTGTATTVSTFQIGAASSLTNNTYAGNGFSGIYIWGADLRVSNDGVNIPSYQRVNTATDYDTTGFPYYLSFNGSSSAMLTNTITPGTDKAQVFAGVRKLSDAARGVIAELSSGIALNDGSMGLFSPEAAGVSSAGFYSKGTTYQFARFDGAVNTAVLTGIGNISGDSAILRINGTQAASSTSDQGTGNYLAYPLCIGARAGTSLWFNGRIYSMIVRFGSNLTTAQITNTEKYVNTKTKAY